MTVKAVIDRFEDGFAVLLVGDEERKFVVTRTLLPKTAREGTWLSIEFDGETIKSATVDQDETSEAKRRISEKMEKLRRGEHKK